MGSINIFYPEENSEPWLLTDPASRSEQHVPSHSDVVEESLDFGTKKCLCLSAWHTENSFRVNDFASNLFLICCKKVRLVIIKLYLGT